jgi:transcriptional regulator with XRE-family HTH domain
MDFREYLRQELERDAEFRREWEESEPAFQVVLALVKARSRLGWTQAELAQRMGTTQANISRAENTGRVTPHFLARFAAAVGGRAVLTLELPDQPNLSLEVAQLAELAASRRLYREPEVTRDPIDKRLASDEDAQADGEAPVTTVAGADTTGDGLLCYGSSACTSRPPTSTSSSITGIVSDDP